MVKVKELEITLEQAQGLYQKYPLPWTFEKLGQQAYYELAVGLGYFTSPPGADYHPDLAPPEAVLKVHREVTGEKDLSRPEDFLKSIEEQLKRKKSPPASG